MYFPIELWREIKNYMLGQEYWKRKMKLCFYNLVNQCGILCILV